MSAEIPDILLERYRLNELSPQETAQLEDRLTRDEPLRRRLEALEQSDAEIRRRYPPEWIAARIRDRLATPERAAVRPSKRSAMLWAAPLAAAATVTLLAVVGPRMPGPPAAETGISEPVDADADRIKGLRPALAVYRRTAQGSETLADGAVGHPGDLLRVGYRAAGRQYGVILSIDGRGSVTMHLPPTGDRAAALKRDATVLLDQAYELDDAPMWERFYFITADSPFAVAPILETARRAAAGHAAAPAELALPHGLEQSTFSVQKETRP